MIVAMSMLIAAVRRIFIEIFPFPIEPCHGFENKMPIAKALPCSGAECSM
jgi:hypothetical protein